MYLTGPDLPVQSHRFQLWIDYFLEIFLGNYGRSFAYASKEFGMTGNTVLMPETAPDSRERIIKEFNVNVQKLPSSKLMDGVRQVCTYIHHTTWKPWYSPETCMLF